VTQAPGLEFFAKSFDLLRLAAPQASRIAYLMPRAIWDLPYFQNAISKAAEQIGVTLFPT
jgi:hypothetical protein